MTTNTKLILLTLVILLGIIVGPLLSIWALNTLFPVLAIPYTFETWAAMIVVHGVLAVKVKKD
jgi:TctA family transporter